MLILLYCNQHHLFVAQCCTIFLVDQFSTRRLRWDQYSTRRLRWDQYSTRRLRWDQYSTRRMRSESTNFRCCTSAQRRAHSQSQGSRYVLNSGGDEGQKSNRGQFFYITKKLSYIYSDSLIIISHKSVYNNVILAFWVQHNINNH